MCFSYAERRIKVAKLTDADKKNIIAAYATGTWTVRELAAKYGVGKTTISQVLNDPRFSDIRTQTDKIKNEELEKTYASMREYFAAGRQSAQTLIGKLLNIPQELIDASSLRDRVGAAHYVKEMFLDPEIDLGGDKVNVVINLADTSINKHNNGDESDG